MVINFKSRKNNKTLFIIIMVFFTTKNNIILIEFIKNKMITIILKHIFNSNIITPELKSFILNASRVFNKMINLIYSITTGKINFTIKSYVILIKFNKNILRNNVKKIIFESRKTIPNFTFTTLELKTKRFK